MGGKQKAPSVRIGLLYFFIPSPLRGRVREGSYLVGATALSLAQHSFLAPSVEQSLPVILMHSSLVMPSQLLASPSQHSAAGLAEAS